MRAIQLSASSTVTTRPSLLTETGLRVLTNEYQTVGYAIVQEAMDPILALSLAHHVGLRFQQEQRLFRERSGMASMGGISHYFTLDGANTRAVVPELVGWYDAIRHLVAAVVDEPALILSPYERSAVNVKLYPARLGSQGWHHDSNVVSALLYLTEGGSSTEMVDLQGETAWSMCHPGNLLILNGREVLHRVPPNETDTARIVAPMNYYLPWDTTRPAWVDRAIYDNISP